MPEHSIDLIPNELNRPVFHLATSVSWNWSIRRSELSVLLHGHCRSFHVAQRRVHSTLGYLSPERFEQMHAKRA